MMPETELILRAWRVTRGLPRGSHVWFDQEEEYVRLFQIPPRDGQEARPRIDEGVDRDGGSGYLDKVGSVSASGQEQECHVDGCKEGSFFREEDELPF